MQNPTIVYDANSQQKRNYNQLQNKLYSNTLFKYKPNYESMIY